MKKQIEILNVDDEEGYRDLFAYKLEPIGIAATCVTNGFQAFRKMRIFSVLSKRKERA